MGGINIINPFFPIVKSPSLPAPSGLRTSSAFLWPRAALIPLETRKNTEVSPLRSSPAFDAYTSSQMSVSTQFFQ